MVFKKIDRYVSWAFLSRFLGVVCLLGVLYVTFDLLKRLEEIQQAGLSNALRIVATYYSYLLALFLADIVPGLVLVSAGMIVVSMARRRELLALKASGTSVYRTVAPIFFWTLLISVTVFGFRETVGPRFARHKEVLNRVLDNDVERELLLRDERFGRKVYVGQYNFPRRTMKDVCLLEFYRRAPLSLQRSVQADTANWLPDGRLQLETVEVRPFEPSGAPGRKQFLPTMTVETDLTAFDFVRAAE
ncbi:MAG: LptF/LptG family permease, partial [Candidatus Brocadiaceae bacterium]